MDKDIEATERQRDFHSHFLSGSHSDIPFSLSYFWTRPSYPHNSQLPSVTTATNAYQNAYLPNTRLCKQSSEYISCNDIG